MIAADDIGLRAPKTLFPSLKRPSNNLHPLCAYLLKLIRLAPLKMILKIASSRTKVLPLSILSLFFLFCYFVISPLSKNQTSTDRVVKYLSGPNSRDTGLWKSNNLATKVPEYVKKGTDLLASVGKISLMSGDKEAVEKTSGESKQEAASSTLSTSGPSDTVPASKKPDHGKVVIVTASSGTHGFLGIPRLKEMVYENRASYAHRHGYEHMWANMTSYNLPNGAPIFWSKIPAIQEAFDRYPQAEWVWFLDIDIIIMEHSLSLWDHVLSPEGMARNAVLDVPIHGAGGGLTGLNTPAAYNYSDVNFLISSDAWGMNTGSFLMRRSEWSDWLFDMWIDPLYIAQGWIFPEQDGWSHMFHHHPIVRKHTVCVGQRALTAYPSYNLLGEHWQPGDIVVHFAGCGDHLSCPEHWHEYWPLREEYEVPASIKQKLEDGTAEIENVQKGVGLET